MAEPAVDLQTGNRPLIPGTESMSLTYESLLAQQPLGLTAELLDCFAGQQAAFLDVSPPSDPVTHEAQPEQG